MADMPAIPWRLPCPWCPFYIEVGARGARGGDPGAGVEAADQMTHHVGVTHERTWTEFLSAAPKEER